MRVDTILHGYFTNLMWVGLFLDVLIGVIILFGRPRAFILTESVRTIYSLEVCLLGFHFCWSGWSHWIEMFVISIWGLTDKCCSHRREPVLLHHFFLTISLLLGLQSWITCCIGPWICRFFWKLDDSFFLILLLLENYLFPTLFFSC